METGSDQTVILQWHFCHLLLQFIDFGEASMTNYYMVRTGQAASLWR